MVRRTEEIHVVAVGSTNFDLVVKAERLPKEGESMMAANLKFFHGGKGANQAVGAARLGAKTSFIGSVGKDMIGDFLIQGLESNGIDTTWVRRDPDRSTGCAFIMLFPNGNNTIVVDPAANFALTPADIERAEEVISKADALCTVLEIPLEVVEASLKAAHKAGKLTVLDAGPPRKCPASILRLADVVSPNETELEELTGHEVSGRVSAREAAESLLEMGAKTVVLKLGSDGAMLVTRKGAKHFPAHKVNAVDPTAAGDAFTAALTVRLAAGEEMEEAIRYANFAGALAVTKLGAQPSLPMRSEVDDFAERDARRATTGKK
ncbi:MAG: ribokinase [Terriglobia bacterium]